MSKNLSKKMPDAEISKPPNRLPVLAASTAAKKSMI